MSDTLDVFEDGRGFYLAWIVDDEEGARVGESNDGTLPFRSQYDVLDDYLYRLAEHIALSDRRGAYAKYGGVSWESRRHATDCLRRIKVAWRVAQDDEASRPWPEWAKTALEQGWKPPGMEAVVSDKEDVEIREGDRVLVDRIDPPLTRAPGRVSLIETGPFGRTYLEVFLDDGRVLFPVSTLQVERE